MQAIKLVADQWQIGGATQRRIDGGLVRRNRILNILGNITASRTQIFAGTGTILLTSSVVPEVYPEWWGAVGSGITDDTAALTAAIGTGKNFSGAFGRNYRFSAKISLTTQGQMINFNNATLTPVGTFDTAFSLEQSQVFIRSVIVNAAGMNGSVFSEAVGINIQQLYFQDIIIRNSTAVAPAMMFNNTYLSFFDRINITGHAGVAMHCRSTIDSTPVNSVWITNSNFSGGTGAVPSLLLEGVAGVWVENCSFQNNASAAPQSDIRIYGNTHVGAGAVTIENCYFEGGINQVGNNIYIGDSPTGNQPIGNIWVKNNYFQSSKMFVRAGAGVQDAVILLNNEFTPIPGVPGPPYTGLIRVIGRVPATGREYSMGQGALWIDGDVAANPTDPNYRNAPPLNLGGSPSPFSTGLQGIALQVASSPGGQINEQVGLTPDWQSGLGCVYGANIAHGIAWGYGSDPTTYAFYRKPFQTPLTAAHLVMAVMESTIRLPLIAAPPGTTRSLRIDDAGNIFTGPT